MKRLLLMGDSIRLGYQEKVKELLKDECEVIFENDNSRFIQYHYWQLNQLLRHNEPFDMVHFNSGYWDMNIESPMKEALNPLPEYVAGLRKVVELIRSQGAIPIFANTVPIFQDGKGSDTIITNATFTYKNEWVLAYNHAAEILMNELHVTINDLYSTMLNGPRYYKCDDRLHLTEEGSQECAVKIAQKIRNLL